MVKNIDFVYDHLVCEFNHYDICLTGLLLIDGKYYYCKCLDEHTEVDVVRYEVLPIEWNDSCQEYLDDYKVAYRHWCYENGKCLGRYGGWSLKWFDDKWKTDPIKNSIKVETTC